MHLVERGLLLTGFLLDNFGCAVLFVNDTYIAKKKIQTTCATTSHHQKRCELLANIHSLMNRITYVLYICIFLFQTNLAAGRGSLVIKLPFSWSFHTQSSDPGLNQTPMWSFTLYRIQSLVHGPSGSGDFTFVNLV